MTTPQYPRRATHVTLAGREFRVIKYHTESYARAAAAPGTKRTLILGNVDDRWGRFWVVSNRFAGHFVRAGFEVARALPVLPK